MASANVTVKVDAAEAARAMVGLSHVLWESQWLDLTGVPWKAVRGKHLAGLNVTLGDKPWKSSVRIAGTALEVPCRTVEVTQKAGDIGWVRFEVPMSHVTVSTES